MCGRGAGRCSCPTVSRRSLSNNEVKARQRKEEDELGHKGCEIDEGVADYSTLLFYKCGEPDYALCGKLTALQTAARRMDLAHT